MNSHHFIHKHRYSPCPCPKKKKKKQHLSSNTLLKFKLIRFPGYYHTYFGCLRSPFQTDNPWNPEIPEVVFNKTALWLICDVGISPSKIWGGGLLLCGLLIFLRRIVLKVFYCFSFEVLNEFLWLLGIGEGGK